MSDTGGLAVAHGKTKKAAGRARSGSRTSQVRHDTVSDTQNCCLCCKPGKSLPLQWDIRYWRQPA